MTARLALGLAAASLVAAALYHIALIFGGPSWFAFAGAPPSIVSSAQTGTMLAPLSAVAIAAVLGVFAALAAAGAGLAPRPPHLRPALFAVAALFLLRGALIAPQLAIADWQSAFQVFHIFASALIVVIGGAFLWGASTLQRTRTDG